MKSFSSNSTCGWLAYYLILLVLLVLNIKPDTTPNMVYRLSFLVMSIAPAILWKHKEWLLPIVILFYLVSASGVGYSFMPTEEYFYVVIGAIIFVTSMNAKHLHVPVILFVMLGWTLFVELVYGAGLFNLHYCLLFVVLAIASCHTVTRTQSHLLMYSFIVAALAISVYILANKQALMVSYNYAGDVERLEMAATNYTAMSLAAGVSFAIIEVSNKYTTRLLKLLCGVTIAVGVSALLLVSSRGAILDVVMVFGYVLFSDNRNKMIYKVLFLALIIVGLIWMYKNGFFDLLMYRMEKDEDGSGRSQIWARKLQAFGQLPIYQQLIGTSYEGGHYLGGTYVFCHNDFVAFLVEYGYIGLLSFIYFIFYPITICYKKNRFVVIACTLFLVTSSLTLEPISCGRMSFFMLYLYTLLYARCNDNPNLIKDC